MEHLNTSIGKRGLQIVKHAHGIKNELAAPSLERSEVCQYVADMALELRTLCKQNDAKYLSYLLEIVFIEANEELIRQRQANAPSADK
jgi:hypothetical protein